MLSSKNVNIESGNIEFSFMSIWRQSITLKFNLLLSHWSKIYQYVEWNELLLFINPFLKKKNLLSYVAISDKFVYLSTQYTKIPTNEFWNQF